MKRATFKEKLLAYHLWDLERTMYISKKDHVRNSFNE